jgi:hypothetical protein
MRDTERDGQTQTDRQQADLINLLIYFQNKERRLKIGEHKKLMIVEKYGIVLIFH